MAVKIMTQKKSFKVPSAMAGMQKMLSLSNLEFYNLLLLMLFDLFSRSPSELSLGS